MQKFIKIHYNSAKLLVKTMHLFFEPQPSMK